MKKMLAVSVLSASLGAIGAGVLAAGDGHALEAAESDANDAESPRACDAKAIRRHRIVRALTGATADAIGITREELRDELADGESIAEVAEAHGVDPADVEAALLADVEARIARATERGVIEAERAAQIIEDAPDRIHEFIIEERAAGRTSR